MRSEEEEVLHGRAVVQAAGHEVPPCQSRWIWPKAAAIHAEPTLEQRKE